MGGLVITNLSCYNVFLTDTIKTTSHKPRMKRTEDKSGEELDSGYDQRDSRVHGEAGVVGGLDAVRLLVELEHLVGVPAV